jgi:hypothetical protein
MWEGCLLNAVAEKKVEVRKKKSAGAASKKGCLAAFFCRFTVTSFRLFFIKSHQDGR